MENIKSRLNWTDTDWAKHLNCHVSKIPEYRKALNEMFLVTIEQNRLDGLYYFTMYRYHVSLAGTKSLQLFLTKDAPGFKTIQDAIDDGNKAISTLEFSDYWAKLYKMPKRVLQMMLIREK